MKKKAALLQMRPEWASPEANRKQVEQLVSRAMGRGGRHPGTSGALGYWILPFGKSGQSG